MILSNMNIHSLSAKNTLLYEIWDSHSIENIIMVFWYLEIVHNNLSDFYPPIIVFPTQLMLYNPFRWENIK